ncbi:dipeptide/oligopeptide/nickel ABC transporter permease/ATP-binding protein [Dactylosporangium sp. NPDC051484]|uniref:dipeptide/oligopeptide/nickel ABC transporter permease/ATP-binding protein n=1 Tax=Dactylosporangium sp. NPDC051484 TaxID=3154942 RepID=UPI00344B3685
MRTLHRLLAIPRRDRLAGVLLVVLAVVVAAVAAAPWLTGADPTAVNYLDATLPPSAAHPFGTDNFGRDLLARVLYGGRASLATAAVTVAVTVVAGTLAGAAAGYLGGWFDLVVTRVIDVLLAFPRLVLAIAVAALLDAGLAGLLLAVSVVSWPGYARVVRGYALQLRDEPYVAAARTAGSPQWRIVGTHVLGGLAGPVCILAMVDVGEVIIAVAGLSFLGLGVRPPQPEWGAMLNEARGFVQDAPWMFLAPGAAIVLVVVAVTYLGDAVRDALEPRNPRLSPRGARRGRAPRVVTLAPDAAVLARLDRLSVRAGDVRILDGVTLELRAGECLGLVGESGSGKSTLAAALLGLLRPPMSVTGSLELLGAPTDGWRDTDWRQVRGRHVSLVTQDPLTALNPVLTIGRQLTETVRAHASVSRAEARRRALAALDLVRLDRDLMRAYPHQLSGGMRQRVCIAIAIINRPRLLICDEPTTALDVSTQARILDELATLRRTLGISMLFISHDLRLVSQVADRVAILHDGRLAEQGPTEEVFAAPAHPYTRKLIDAAR